MGVAEALGAQPWRISKYGWLVLEKLVDLGHPRERTLKLMAYIMGWLDSAARERPCRKILRHGLLLHLLNFDYGAQRRYVRSGHIAVCRDSRLRIECVEAEHAARVYIAVLVQIRVGKQKRGEVLSGHVAVKLSRSNEGGVIHGEGGREQQVLKCHIVDQHEKAARSIRVRLRDVLAEGQRHGHGPLQLRVQPSMLLLSTAEAGSEKLQLLDSALFIV